MIGRYGEEFIEKRCEKLQMWTNRIARHPVLSRSDVVYHFLTCPDGDEKVQDNKIAIIDLTSSIILVMAHPVIVLVYD